MANELSPWANYPTAPGDTGLAPSPASGGNLPAIDHLGNQSIAGRQVNAPARTDNQTPQVQAQYWFGQPVEKGVTVEMQEHVLGVLSATFAADMHRLQHPTKVINAAVAWLSANFDQETPRETRRHNYQLHELTGDPLMEAFANHMSRVNASQAFISNCVWYCGALVKQIESAASGAGSPRTAPIQRKPQPGDEARFEKDAQRCETVLRNKWGHSYNANLEIVQDWLDKQPKEVQAHFSQPTTNALSGLNDPELILMLFAKATDSEIPKAASNIHKEIQAIEAIMKHERRRYNSDLNMQQRLRALYVARDGN